MRGTFHPYRPFSPTSRYGWVQLWCVLLILSSCKKNFSSSQFENDKLVVLAEITAGDSVKIPVGKTIKTGGGSIIRFEKVNDATVVLKQDTMKGWTLQPNWSAMYSSNPTTVFTNRRHFRYNTTYSLEVNHPALGTVKATTHIPPSPKVSWADTLSTTYNGKNVLEVSLSWQDAPDRGDYYILEAVKETVKLARSFVYRGVKYDYDSPQGKALYDQVSSQYYIKIRCDTIPTGQFTRLNIYTDDTHSANVNIDNLGNPFRRIFFTDDAYNGSQYSTKIYIDPAYFIAPTPQQRGKVRIQFKTVSRELYEYLLTYEKYKTDFGTVPANQLASPVGNITNGLGIFGGSSRKERVFYFDQLN